MTDSKLSSLRLEILPANAVEESDDDWGFVVRIYVDDIEMTTRGAGLGMDPSDLLVPRNLLRESGHGIAVARCTCGVYGCGATDIDIAIEADSVVWTWRHEVPQPGRTIFDRDAYFSELDRIDSDHSWESAARTVARIIQVECDATHLERHGLELGWVDRDFRDPNMIVVSMNLKSRSNPSQLDAQVFLRVQVGDDPRATANGLLATLRQAPRTWTA